MHRRTVLASLAVGGLGGCLRLASEDDGSETTRTAASTESSETVATATNTPGTPSGDAETSEAETTDAETTDDETRDLAEPELDWWTTEGTPRSVVADGDTAYVAGSSGPLEGVTALDVRTGEQRWHAHRSRQFPSVTPTYDDGSLYVGSGDADARIFELDAETGRTLAQFDPDVDGLFDGILALSGEFVLVTTGRSYQDGHRVYLLDRDGLDVVWERHFPGDEHGANPVDGAIVDGTAILANPNQTFAVRLRDGADRWQLDEGSFVVARVDDWLVYVHRERVAARPVAERSVEWSTGTGGRDVTLHPDDGVFVVATQEGVRTYDIGSGEETWSTPFEDVEYGKGLFDPRPTTSVRDETVWVWSRETLCGFDAATGEQTTKVSLPSEPNEGYIADAGVFYWRSFEEPMLYGAGAGPL